VDLHWHEQMEIIYVKRGSGTISVNLKPMKVSAGCIMPILPGELHAILADPDERMEYENIIFSLSILDSTDENDWCRSNVIQALEKGTLHFSRPIRPGSGLHAVASETLDKADLVSEMRSPGYPLLLKSCLFQLLFSLYTHKTRDNTVQASPHEHTMKKIILYVREHFSERITVEDAAEAVEYSPSHFMRFFKQETGHTFVNYLNEYRLAYAGYLLKESTEQIGSIASRCGFDNFSYFIRLFRKKYGLSPKEYRNGA